MGISDDYKLFMEFIDKYKLNGFTAIDTNDLLVKRLNVKLAKNKQHFHIADMVDLKIIYVNDTIENNLGIRPEDYSPGTELELVHQDDYNRFMIVRSNFIKLCTNMYPQPNEYGLMSSSIRFKHANGSYKSFLLQGYAFSSTTPKPLAYGLAITTDIDWYGPIKHGFNYYFGKDLSYFRFPDKELIETGCIFTDREFEILKLLRLGLDSKNIAGKLFISPHTVDTHRRNMLKKTGHHNTSELIIDLQEKGFF